MSLHWEDPLIGNFGSRAFRREKLHQDPAQDVTFGSIRVTSCQACLASSAAHRSRAATGQSPAPSPGSAAATCSSSAISAYWPPTMTPPKRSTCSSTWQARWSWSQLKNPSTDRCLRLKLAAVFVVQLPARSGVSSLIGSLGPEVQRAKISPLVATTEKGETVGRCPAAGKLRPCRDAR